MKHWLYYFFGCVFLSISTWWYKRRTNKLAAKANQIGADLKAVMKREEINRGKEKIDRARDQNMSTVVDVNNLWGELQQRDKKRRDDK